MMIRRFLSISLLAVAALAIGVARPASASTCDVPDNVVRAVNAGFAASLGSGNGGFFTPNMMWGAIVDRKGQVCSIVKVGDAWPGSRAIAIAKAETANDFSNNKLALSTANLYNLAVPGGSLFGLNESNPYNPFADDARIPTGYTVPGGIITFGGGVPLYEGNRVIGGFGVSGDTSCADHAVAYEARTAAIRSGAITRPPNNDNIVYGTLVNSTQHPHCTSHDRTPPN